MDWGLVRKYVSRLGLQEAMEVREAGSAAFHGQQTRGKMLLLTLHSFP